MSAERDVEALVRGFLASEQGHQFVLDIAGENIAELQIEVARLTADRERLERTAQHNFDHATQMDHRAQRLAAALEEIKRETLRPNPVRRMESIYRLAVAALTPQAEAEGEER